MKASTQKGRSVNQVKKFSFPNFSFLWVKPRLSSVRFADGIRSCHLI